LWGSFFFFFFFGGKKIWDNFEQMHFILFLSVLFLWRNLSWLGGIQKKGGCCTGILFWKDHEFYEIAIFRHLASSLSPKRSGILSQFRLRAFDL
jgi:hypothetical protein